MVAPEFQKTEYLHDAFIRLAEKVNRLVEKRLLQQLDSYVGPGLSPRAPKVTFNGTQASIILAIHNHPKGVNTPARIARRLKLESSRISHQIKSLKQYGWIVDCPGIGKLSALKLTKQGSAAALSASKVKDYLEGQLRKNHAKEFDIVKATFLPQLDEKLSALLGPKLSRVRKKKNRAFAVKNGDASAAPSAGCASPTL